MERDSYPFLADNDTYRYALNQVDSSIDYGGVDDGGKYLFGLSTERSNELWVSVPTPVYGYTYLEERDWFIIFCGSNEIGYVDIKDGTPAYKKIYNCDEWNFNDCEWVYCEFKNMAPCGEVFMYWPSGCHYHVLNIDEAIDPQRSSGITCEDTRLFKPVSIPFVSSIVSERGGGGLISGAYQFVTKFRDKKGNETNWFFASQPAYVSGDNHKAGERSNSAIRVTVDYLDTRYNVVDIAVIKTISGKKTAELIKSKYFNTNGISFTYTGIENGTPIDIEELYVKKRMWVRGQDLIQKNNMLFLYRIKQEKNPNLQRKVMQAQVSFPTGLVRQEDAYKYKGFLPGERYALGVVYHHIDGTSTNVFHIPAGGGGGGGTTQPESGANKEQLIPKKTFLEVRASEAYGSIGDENYDEGSASFGGGGGGSYTASEFEEEDEYRGSIRDVLNKLKEIASNTEKIDENCECSDCGSALCEEQKEVAKKNSATAFSFLKGLFEGEKDRIEDDSIENFSDDPVEALQQLIDSVLNKKIKRRKGKSVYNNARSAIAAFTSNLSDPPIDTSLENTTLKPTMQTRDAKSDIALMSEYASVPFISEELYPDTKDCNGQPIYGSLAGGGIRHHEVPSSIPLVFSTQKGVVNHNQLDNTEWNDTWYVVVGLKVSNVYIPTDDELGKPLNRTRPYSIVMMPRDDANKHIIGQGVLIHTFRGNIQGVPHAFPKNGVNSREYIDRHIQTGGDDNHIGSDGSSQYVLIGPDFMFKRPGLIVDEVRVEPISGSGARYGLYAQDLEHDGGAWSDRYDQRACRGGVNLNQHTPGGSVYGVSGISYAPGNRTVKAPKGIDVPLCNMYRESSVYLQIEGGPTYNDNSFVGDGLVHECNITDAQAGIATLMRGNPAQYGKLENATYIETGLVAVGIQTTVQGFVGDSFVGHFAFKRSAYISNKVGTDPIEVPNRIYNGLHKFLAMDDCTRLPDSNDEDDIKNRINMHPGAQCPGAGGGEDLYYPKVLNYLVHIPVRAETNIHKLELGDPKLSELHYPNLKTFYLDAGVPKGTPWQKSFLNQFYCEVKRPAKWRRVLAGIMRILFFTMPLFIGINQGLNFNSIPDVVLTIIRLIVTILTWFVLNFLIFTPRRIKQYLDIPYCPNDDEDQAYRDDCIRNWTDNFDKYNGDFDIENDFTVFYGIPDVYNTCDCDDCQTGPVTNEILISNPQDPSSQIDNYRNFNANSYVDLPVHAGPIQRMVNVGGRLLAHTTDNIYNIDYQRTTQFIIGDSTPAAPLVFGEPQEYLGGIEQGTLGTWDPNAGMMSPFGYTWVDWKAKAIYLMSPAGGIEEISRYGMKKTLRKLLEFCNSNDCRDEKSVSGSGFVIGLDPTLERILFTKIDGDKSFTLSYSPMKKKWISFHSYIPQFYMWDRDNLFSLKEGGIWKHNKADSFGSFYGKKHTHEIEFVASSGGYKHRFLYNASLLWTEARKDNLTRLDKTYEKGVLYNTDQSTGVFKLVPFDFDDQESQIKYKGGDVDRKYTQNHFTYNSIFDWHNNKSSPVIIEDSCDIVGKINTNPDYDNSDPGGEKIEDNHLIHRYIYEGDGKTELNTFFVETQVTFYSEDPTK